MKRGYLALYRKIQDHPFYKERREFSKLEAWIDILMEVQHSEKPEEVLFGMKMLICNYGESLKSVLTWATRWHWSESKVRRFFLLLKKLKQIDFKSEQITTRLTVLNYSIYDPKRRASDEQVTSIRRASDEQVTTDKHVNIKALKNDKNKKIKNRSFKKYLQEKIIENNFIETKDKIFEFYNYRQSMPAAKRYKSEKGINGLFRNLNDCREAGLIISECLEIAMEKNWLSFESPYFKNNRSNKKIISAGDEWLAQRKAKENLNGV